MRTRTPIVVLSTLALAGSALAIIGAPASARPDDPAPAATNAVSSKARLSPDAWAAGRARFGAEVTAAQALEAYWTPARMRAAKPIEASKSYQTALEKYQRDGKPADQPDAKGPQSMTKPAPGSIKLSGKPSPAAADPNFWVGHPTARTSGKVFFSTPGGDAQCSATVINSEGANTVWTAGHCVNAGAGGPWYWNWVFAPNYDDDLADPAPYGYWWAVELWSLCGWTCPGWGDFSYDMGVAIMGTMGGWHIVHYLGGQGLVVHTGVGQWINAFGYPAEWPFDGGNLFQCWGHNNWEWFAATSWIPCDMTRGSSGGAWLWAYDGNWGYLNGVNSRIDRIVNPTVMFSPYFDDDAVTLYDATRFR